jgi:GTP pyrophosphokinase
VELETLFKTLTRLTDHDKRQIEHAYHYAKDAHGDELRKSGEPFITHPLAVAQILAEVRMDVPTISAALLHDVVEDTGITQADLEREFGDEVARLVDGVTKVERLPTEAGGEQATKPHEQNAEFLRKIFLAMGNDIRVILIKLADRLHNMRTLGHLPPEKQIRMARETIEIFAPLANRLGIWQMKWELEDLCLRYLDPEKYREIARQLDERRVDREAYLKRKQEELRTELAKHGLTEAIISARPKHIYSIWKKMDRKKVSFDHIYDMRAVRVIVNSIPECYLVLGVAHNLWTPIPEEFDDYVMRPKPNGYKSIHIAVRDGEGKVFEVQIRTHEMHEHAEYGVAAHWRYKEGAKYDKAFDERIKLLRRAMEFSDDPAASQNAVEYVEQLKDDVFREGERVHVFSPKNDIFELPAGATPIDFAYHIHSSIGDRCRGARVNGMIVNLDYILKNGEVVEIITAKRGGPSRDWLSPTLGYVRTNRARAKIRAYFRKEGRDKNIAQGREVLDRELKRIGFDQYPREALAKMFELNVEELLAKVGFGDITIAQIIARLSEEERKNPLHPSPVEMPLTPSTVTPGVVNVSDGINISGETGFLINLATCCRPTHGDMIVGYVTRGKGVTVHRADCTNIINISERERLVPVNWGIAHESRTYPVNVKIMAMDREGLMRDVSGVISDEGVNMSNVNSQTRKNTTTMYLTLEVEDTSQLSRVLVRVGRVPNVMDVARV